MRPCRAAASSIQRRALSGSPRSTGCMVVMDPPASRTRAAVSRLPSSFTSQPTTCAPASANRKAAARPWPPPVPVINTALPVKGPAIAVKLSAFGSFVRIDRLLVIDHANIHQHAEHVGDAVDVNDLVVLEFEPGEPPHIDFLTLGLNAQVGTAGLLSVVVAQHADFVVAASPSLDRAVQAGRKCLVKTLRRTLPLLERTEIRAVRVGVGHL